LFKIIENGAVRSIDHIRLSIGPPL